MKPLTKAMRAHIVARIAEDSPYDASTVRIHQDGTISAILDADKTYNAPETTRALVGRVEDFADGRNPFRPADDPGRTMLSAILTQTGLSQVELAEALGRDERTMRRWMARDIEVPESVRQLLRRLTVTVTDSEIRLTVRRGT